MNNELVVSQNESNEAFIAKLNNAIGFTEGLPVIPILKFDAQTGKFLRSTGEKDREGKTIYEELSEEIGIHIITSRKIVQTDYSSETYLSSREFTGNYVELFNQNRQLVMKGIYKDLKANNPNLKFVQVLYVIYDGKPYKFKLSGSKLQNLFPYFTSFQNDSLACWMTVASKGKQLINGAVKYYELNFHKGEQITDKDLIVSRVNDVNTYIKLINQARNAEYQNNEFELPIHDQQPLPEIEGGYETPITDYSEFEPEDEDAANAVKNPL